MLGDLALKARMTTDTLNSIEGVRCNELMGAMYAFPRLFLPEKAVAEAKVGPFVSPSIHLKVLEYTVFVQIKTV